MWYLISRNEAKELCNIGAYVNLKYVGQIYSRTQLFISKLEPPKHVGTNIIIKNLRTLQYCIMNFLHWTCVWNSSIANFVELNDSA